jgi:hypothetical protein
LPVPKLVLTEHRRVPDPDRIISGECSACGDILLAWLENDDASPNQELLRAKLDKVFEQHIADKHSNEATA